MRISEAAHSLRVGSRSVSDSRFRGFRIGWILVSAAVVAGSATAMPASATTPTPKVSAAAPSLPSLSVAEHEAKNLGPVPASAPVSFTLALQDRDPSGLQTLVDQGDRLTTSQWVSTYGPEPSMTAAVRRSLAGAGLSSTWEAGDSVLGVSGSARSVSDYLHVTLHRYLLYGNTRFYAPLTQPVVPRELAHEVAAITGPNDYPSDAAPAIPDSQDGVTPKQMSQFYDLTPLRAAGLDGKGMTVIFPEGAVPDTSTLTAFAAKFHLPPFNLTVHTDPSAWGSGAVPSDSWYGNYAGEASLDLEVVHGLAPEAREVVYVGGGAPPQTLSMLQTMVTKNQGSILSASTNIGNCEQSPDARSTAVSADAIFAQAAAEGTTVLFASGDRAAFQCIPDADPATEGDASVYLGADSPDVTAVGGTSAFFAVNGAYYKEAAWGEPLETWGSGGGISTFFPQPSYQVAPGLAAKSLGGRGVPDVACDADPVTSGWDIFVPPAPSLGETSPQEEPVGGTSAATPCWAAIIALIDQDLVQLGLPKVGFANPALYYFARDPSGLPATPFHQVTEGSNLHFVATPGWNAATGLGTPDVGHLADDFEWYVRNHLAAR
jgi:subtilase family serine protease